MGTKNYLHGNMFHVPESLRGFVSKFWVFVFGMLSYIFGVSFEAGKCYIKGKNIEESGQIEKGSKVDNGEKVYRIEGETEMASRISKCEFLSGKNISGFIEEPKSLIFSVQELNMGSCDRTNGGNKILHTEGEDVIDQAKEEDSVDKVSNKKEEESFLDTSKVINQNTTEDFFDGFLTNQYEETSSSDTGMAIDVEKIQDSVSGDKVLKKPEEETFTENDKSVFTEFRFLPKYDLSTEVQFLSKDCSVDSEFDTIGSSDEFSRSNEDIELDAYVFLAERNFTEVSGTECLEAICEVEVKSNETTLDQETHDTRDLIFDSDDDYIELKLEPNQETHGSSDLENHEEEDLFLEEVKTAESQRLSEEFPKKNSAVSDEEIISGEDSNEDEDNQEDLVYEATHLGHTSDSENFEESSLEDNQFISDDDDDEEEDEFALEHDDLIEQLKMELKNARTGGLPTILEESESTPKTVEELMPLEIDLKFQHKDHMKEIHKFYRSYLEKMRKLDILNSQTMHAIGLFQLKGPGQSIKTHKSSVPAIKSLLFENLWPCKSRISEADPVFKFIGDLHKDFELVYVGQLCLSWEILHWQYRKALELQEFDSQQLHQYNQVAGEFQLFQVLLQRFIENEPFQGCPRVQNYVNNRCACRYFLQVPVIKDDSLKDKKGRNGDGEDAITCPMLTEIIEESIRVYWEFLCGNKDENDVILKGLEIQDSVDSELLVDIRTDYQKKEKRLKEILRSGCCIVKKLQRHHHENGFNRSLFITQIELKLISRVLTMSKITTDQLVWCHEKLAKINFCNRKIVFEPSFFLFPC